VRILYVGKHGSGGNDDEGAIHDALESLGHSVSRLRESNGHKVFKEDFTAYDFCLFHKWHTLPYIRLIKVPRVFWYFDLVDWPVDPTLKQRNEARIDWMERITPHVALGFMSDGDWLARVNNPKLHWLTQGADQRYAGYGAGSDMAEQRPILMTGIRSGGGAGRIAFIDEMLLQYREAFSWIQKGVHGQALADTIANSKIVVAPTSPVTNRYWSNRVYLTLGYGGFLLHPFSERLAEHYEDGKEIIYYSSMEDLYDKIKFYSGKPFIRRRIQDAGLSRTLAEHTYRHRCAQLIEVVKRELGL